jgi:hypothetical protein
MQPSPPPLTAPPGVSTRDAQISGLVYQGVTIVAMLLLLASLWLF